MLLAWEAWAKMEDNDGAAKLFRDAHSALTELEADRQKLRAITALMGDGDAPSIGHLNTSDLVSRYYARIAQIIEYGPDAEWAP